MISAILVLCLVGVLVASPFGIFFANGGSSPDAVAPSSAVAQINSELSDYLAALQTGGTYDRIEILGQPPAWSDVFAVFAAKTAGATGGVDVVTLDTARVDLLRAVFWDIVKITSAEEPMEHPAVGSTPAWTENVLKITITPRTPDDMRVFYNVTGGSYIIGHGGGAHSQHGYCTAITWDQAIPGDLVFYPNDTHVGIVGGRDESGNLLIIHCTYSKDNVVITDKSGFTSIAMPNYYI